MWRPFGHQVVSEEPQNEPEGRYTLGTMSEALHIADLFAEIEIPHEGTLSQVLHRDDDVRVVLFAFDAGQELSEHTASVPAIVQVISGHLRLTLGTDVVEARPGSWIHMPARLPHAVSAVEPSVMLLTMLTD